MTKNTSESQRRTTNRTASKNQFTKKEFQQRLGELADRWKIHHAADLALRHETGTLLNLYYGEPTHRQLRGQQVMKEAGKALGKTEAELSQLRRFAYHFTSLKELKRQHPQVTTWTQVRDLLILLHQGQQGRNQQTRREAPTNLRRITSRLSALTAALGRTKKSQPTQSEVEKMLEKFQELAQAVPDWLKVRIMVTSKRIRKAS
jgi:hypothetical protein